MSATFVTRCEAHMPLTATFGSGRLLSAYPFREYRERAAQKLTLLEKAKVPP